MIDFTDLAGVEKDLALRLIGFARTIAPRLDDLPAGRDRDIAIAVLKGIAKDTAARGSRFVKGQRIGPAAIEYLDVGSLFGSDDRATLRSLGSSADSASHPIGHFPRPGVVGHMWPETYDG